MKIDESKYNAEETLFCTGWALIDGLIACTRKIKKYFSNQNNKKQATQNYPTD